MPDGTRNHQTLKKAYRRLDFPSFFDRFWIVFHENLRQAALKWHPDKNPNDPMAASNFQKACNAFERLDTVLFGANIYVPRQICKVLGFS